MTNEIPSKIRKTIFYFVWFLVLLILNMFLLGVTYRFVEDWCNHVIHMLFVVFISGGLSLLVISKTSMLEKFNLKGSGKGLFFYTIVFYVGLIFITIFLVYGNMSYNLNCGMPGRCQFGASIDCVEEEFLIKNSTIDTVSVNLVNNFGATVIISNITAITDWSGVVCNDYYIDGNAFLESYEWTDGSQLNLRVDCDNADILRVADKAKFQIDIDWYATSAGPEYTRTVQGEIFAEVLDSGKEVKEHWWS